MRVDLVIGANYGDEGKGLVTEFLCLSGRNVVALANGGCQRGHTVTTRIGGRHVFHHFGSGTFRGAATCFCKDFLLNPMQFVAEAVEIGPLARWTCRDRRCHFQLPIDICVNRMLEAKRGDRRHGSVGCGIWETTRRVREGGWPTFDEFLKFGFTEKVAWLKDAQKRVFEKRAAEEGLEPNGLSEMFMSDGMVRHFAQDCEATGEASVPVRSLTEACSRFAADRVVFEQGQGLALDQSYGTPVEHTTPSYTGSVGVAEILNEEDFGGDVSLNYVTRTYATRHGAGPFPEETPGMSFPDETNVPNDWQGGIRFGALTERTVNRIRLDAAEYRRIRGEREARLRLFVTHANEMEIPDFIRGDADYVSKSVYADEIKRA